MIYVALNIDTLTAALLRQKIRPPMTEASVFDIPVLCYHSWRIEGLAYATNDHVALEQDLLDLRTAGYQLLPIPTLISVLRDHSSRNLLADKKLVCVTFDDGLLYDVEDKNDLQLGLIASFKTLLNQEHRVPKLFCEGPKAVSFVIASPKAREELRFCSDPQGYWNLSDDWWLETAEGNTIAIGNHSWDHTHPDVNDVKQREGKKGSFLAIDNADDARAQVIDAQHAIDKQTQGLALKVFCYPFGEVPDFLCNEYLPIEGAAAGIEAAFSTGGDLVRPNSNLWNLPRLVCGEHWREEGALLPLIESLRHQA